MSMHLCVRWWGQLIKTFLTEIYLTLISFVYEWLIEQIWRLKQQNQIKLPDGGIYLWKQKCSSHKQLSTTAAFEVP